MAISPAFSEAYARLNAAQKQAVDTIEGPVMVIAGPGTGKTQILALRIANILRQTDTAPSSILALTFTESGVHSMRARLVSLIGQDGYRVRIHTFHGFCNEVIRTYPDAFPDLVGRTPLIELDAIAFIKQILDEQRPVLLRPHGKPDLYVRDIVQALSSVKREHIAPTTLRARIAEARTRVEQAPDLYHEKGAHKGKMRGMYTTELRMLERADAFVDVYEAYERTLVDAGRYDFEDTIIAVIETLARDEELKLILQEEHQYILADEHQDANGSQNELLVLLSDFHERPNLFIVGDEKQAIYRFQGASLENFFGFKRQWPDAVLIPLTENYRSTQRILDAAHALIAPARSAEEIDRPTLAARAAHPDAAIVCAVAPDEEIEQAHLAQTISEQIVAGVAPSEIAVLVRRNSDIGPLSRALARRQVPYAAYGDDPVLTHPVIEGFISHLAAIAQPHDDALMYRALALPYSDIGMVDLYRLTDATRRYPGALFAHVLDMEALTALGLSHPRVVYLRGQQIEQAHRALARTPLILCIEQILWRSGCMAYVLAQPDALALLDVLRTFFRYLSTLMDAHPSYTLADLLTALAEAKEYRLALGSTSFRPIDAVSLMTVHRAKGMEFDHVYIPQVHDRLWGAKRSMDRLPLPLFDRADAATGDDERRLFYVAMTRARKTLTFSYALRAVDGTQRIPSRFLEEIKDAHVQEQSVADTGSTFFVPPVDHEPLTQLSEEERAYLSTRFLNQGLSVSALNNYLESPWKYFFVNLLRIPQARALHLLYGTAMDETLKWYTDQRASGNVPDVDAVQGVFARVLARQPLTKKDYETYRARGVTALAGYLAAYADTWVADAQSAVRIMAPFETGRAALPTLMLRGELDKVEQIADGLVRVVDYKTGTPKTRGEIMGTTKSSHGNLKRQLVFYKLLLELDPERGQRTEEGVLDFVEPDQKGRYRRETLSLAEDDVSLLRTCISDVAEEIATFSFWDTPCDPQSWSDDGCALVTAFTHRRALFS